MCLAGQNLASAPRAVFGVWEGSLGEWGALVAWVMLGEGCSVLHVGHLAFTRYCTIFIEIKGVVGGKKLYNNA